MLAKVKAFYAAHPYIVYAVVAVVVLFVGDALIFGAPHVAAIGRGR